MMNSIEIQEQAAEIATEAMKQQFEQPIRVERRGKDLVLMRGDEVVGTLSSGKKSSYGKDIQNRFQEKRRQAYLAKQAQSQQATIEQ